MPFHDRSASIDLVSLDHYESSESSSARIIEDYVEDVNVNVSSPYLRAKSPPSDNIYDLASSEVRIFRNRNTNPEYTPNNKAINRHRKKIPTLSQELLELHDKSIAKSPGSKGILRIGRLRLGTSGDSLSDFIEGSSVGTGN